ncbi:hypothetical protein PybrP1_009091, partial [[Pythium] brassicae (nom. inval.)]
RNYHAHVSRIVYYLVAALLENFTVVPNLRVLMLGKNRLWTVENLECLKKLDDLVLHSNGIEVMQNLNELRVLNLGGNRVSTLENIDKLALLTELNRIPEAESAMELTADDAEDAGALKRRRTAAVALGKRALRSAPASTAQSESTKRQRRKVADTTPLVAPVRSTRELIRDADDRFARFLADELDERRQAQLAAEFGFGQGYLVKTPAPSAWKRKKERARLAEWLLALGFAPRAYAHRCKLFRIASLRADIILHELHQRALPEPTGERAAAPSAATSTDSRSAQDAPVTMAALATDPAIETFRRLFSALDAQPLEIVSLSEHDRMLSSSRHAAIADAMEEVLAQPSARKEKSRARRLSRLGRIAGRRLSLVPISQSALPALVEDDVEWDDGDDACDNLGPLARDSLGVGSATARERWPSTGARSVAELKHHAQLKLQQRKITADNVLRLVLRSQLLPLAVLRGALRNVSTSWRHISTIQARKSMADVYEAYPRGHYLSDGAYKEVHKVFSTRHKRLEAVSVMDIEAIESTGNQSVVRQEIAHAILLSELVESKTCPNFLRIYDLFVSSDAPRADRWGSATYRRPSDILTDKRLSVDPASLASICRSGAQGSGGLHQYIQMEFCDGGDLEDFISLQPEKLLPVATVVLPLFFQMAFSLYCARERFHFRHCDIKLLNFFLKDIPRESLNKKPNDDVVLQYAVEETAFDLRLPPTFAYWIKLADYGTAESNAETLGSPVALDQFTTLENTPIEYLLEGDAAEQSFAGDTFSLGLSLLHLFTGSAPYEEILESVRCPRDLLQALKYIWTNPRKTSGFAVLRRVIKDDSENILYHTLYRYLVLFGLPEETPTRGAEKVWQAIRKYLYPQEAAMTQTRRSRSATASARAAKSASSAANQFEQDRARFSLASGTEATIQRGRARLEAAPGGLELLSSLVHFDPTKRPTMKSVLLHPFFAALRVEAQQHGGALTADFVVDTYRRKAASAGGALLLDV